jgi:hypothetical protein
VEPKKPGRVRSQEPKKDSRWGFHGMTVRDWLELLIVPLVLLGIGLLFQMQQNEVEERRAEAARELEEQRAQDAALQSYLDQRDLANNLATPRLSRDRQNGFPSLNPRGWRP